MIPRSLWLLVCLLLLPAAVRAQAETSAEREGAASFTMPLPSPDLPDGVLTVKVVGRGGMEDRKVGEPVTLLRLGKEGQTEPVQTARTGEDGRARFEKLTADARYQVRVEVEGRAIDSDPFAGPSEGGLRLLLSLGNTPAMPGGPEARGSGVPPDHPPIGGAGLPGGHPLAGGHGGRGGSALVKAAPDLEVGQIMVKVVKGTPPRPVSGAMVIAPGVKSASGHPVTDGEGKLLISLSQEERKAGLPGLTVVKDDYSYRSEALKLPAKGGLEVTFTMLERSRDLKALSIGRGSQLVMQPGEGALTVMELLHIQNGSQTLVEADAAGLQLPLPRGARSPEIAEEQRGLLAVDAERGLVRFTAPLPPGRTDVRVFFELPHAGPEVDFSQKLPLPAAEVMAAVRGRVPALQVFGPSVKSSTDDGTGGVRLLLGVAPSSGRLEFTVSGLPYRNRRAALLAVALAGLVLLWALPAAWAGPRQAARRAQRREALLQQLVQLHRSKHRGEAVAQRRKNLVKELSSIWEPSER